MNAFVRVVRLAMRQRWTFAASVVCALLVATLWGGNISAIFPVMQVTFEQGTLHKWIDDEIAASESFIATSNERIAEIDALGDSKNRKLKAERAELASRVRQKQAGLLWSRALRDYVIYPWLPRDRFRTIAVVIGLLLAGTALKGVFLVAHQVLVSRLSHMATFNLRNQFFRRTLRMDVAYFGADGSSQLMSRFTYDLENVSAGLNELFGKLVREPLKMLACLIAAGLICWRLLVFSLVLAPLAAWSIRRLAKALKSANRRAMEEMSQIYNVLEETFGGIKVVKAFTMERHERRRLHSIGKKFFLKSMRIARYDALTRPLTELMGMMTICMAILAGAYLVLEQQTHLFGIRMSNEPLSVPLLIAFYGFLAGISDPARKLSEVFSRIQRASAAADRIYQLIDREPRIVDPRTPVRINRHSRDICFDSVSFGYQPTHLVLEEINLRIEHGETLAIVGPNGCGKSTLASLIPRFIDPVVGSVSLDGVDLRDMRMRDLRQQIGLVNQETLLFDDTVYNNIRYGSPWATREDVLRAARQAHAHRFIEERLENGYETMVGPRGGMLSGGQRQRIALARAILRDPAILILDEATSQIDLESEQLIQKVLEQFTRNRTTILITHRMATLALADRIVVMQAGRIIDVGGHTELLRRCELYSRLYDIQLKDIA